jgi:radical SAM superfamily enzyme YgiQ (UPF0313 family)
VKNPLRVNARIAYVYPGSYEAMTSSLAHDLLYTYVNKRDDVYLERFTLDSGSGLRSIETGSPLKDFDAILTTLHYELDIANLVRLLSSAGLDPRRGGRSIPVIAGGPVVMANPMPYMGVVDAFVVGEIEATIGGVVDAVSKRAGEGKKAVLEELSDLSYVFAPGFNEGAERRYAEDLNGVEYPLRQVYDTEREPAFGLGFKLEVSRGCLFHCSFCMETRLFQPFRHRSMGRIKELVERGLEYNGLDRVVVYALSFPVVREDVELLEYLAERGLRAVLPSIRLEKIDKRILELIKGIGQRELTLAPESFSFFTQRALMKYPGLVNLLSDKIESVLEAGFDVKLYLIYGVKGEGLRDLEETLSVLRDLAGRARLRGRRLIASFNPLIPKARTPFAYIGMRPLEELRAMRKLIEKELRGVGVVRELDIKEGLIQAALSLGGGGLADAVVEWSLRGGGYSNWVKVVREKNLDLSYVQRGLNPEEEPPWRPIVIDKTEEKVLEAQLEVLRSLVSSKKPF